MMTKHFNKELDITKKDNEKFESSTKCWICDNAFVESNVKVRDHYHVTKKIESQSKLNIPVMFHNLKDCDVHLVMQELGKSDFEMLVVLILVELWCSGFIKTT